MVDKESVANKLVLSLCLISTGYMTFVQLRYYIINQDQSSISFRKFNSELHDQYPTFTLCWVHYNYLKNNHALVEADGVRVSYLDVLQGRKKVTSDFTMITFDEAVTDFFHDIVNTTYTKTKHGEKINIKGRSAEDPYVKSHQDSNRICYTKKSSYDKNLILDHEFIELNLDEMNSPTMFTDDVSQINLYVHQRGQLIRQMGNPVFSLDIGYLKQLTEDKKDTKDGTTGYYTYELVFRVTQVEVLRKRVKGGNSM